MSKPERLDILDGPESDIGTDIVSVWDDDGSPPGYLFIKTHSSCAEGMEGPLVMLDSEQVRQLFNWLGVWLHT